MSGDVAQKSHPQVGFEASKTLKIVSFCNFESLRKLAPDTGPSSLPWPGSLLETQQERVQDDVVFKDECCMAASKHLGN